MRYRRLTCMLIALRRLFADIFLKGSECINPALFRRLRVLYYCTSSVYCCADTNRYMFKVCMYCLDYSNTYYATKGTTMCQFHNVQQQV